MTERERRIEGAIIRTCKCGAVRVLTSTGVRYEENAGAIIRHRVEACEAFTRDALRSALAQPPDPRFESFKALLLTYARAVEAMERAHVRGTRAAWEDAAHAETVARLALYDAFTGAQAAALAQPPPPDYVRGQEDMRERAAVALPLELLRHLRGTLLQEAEGLEGVVTEDRLRLMAWLALLNDAIRIRSLPLEAASEEGRPVGCLHPKGWRTRPSERSTYTVCGCCLASVPDDPPGGLCDCAGSPTVGKHVRLTTCPAPTPDTSPAPAPAAQTTPEPNRAPDGGCTCHFCAAPPRDAGHNEGEG